MSNRRRLKASGAVRSVGGSNTRPCAGCGASITLDPQQYGSAVHMCDTGEWYLMRRDMADALNGMTTEEVADWAGVPVEDVRRIRAARYRRDGATWE